MNGDQWSQIKRILNSAVQLRSDERPRYVAEACAGDERLRVQIDSILNSPKELDSFLENGAAGAFAGTSDNFAAEFQAGTKLGRYSIVEVIGLGGMGVVYLAEDLDLHRNVAIKVLPPYVADKARIQRFEQEARAASGLNHPNILTIHETGEFEGSRYIVSEYVKGSTLRERIGKLRISEALDIASQIASALEAAHRNGIFHRDIKPENVMIREDGLVKVLDFGLAKLTENRYIAADGERSHLETAPGILMGTVSYMSPEQARGSEVDSRTDIFSLGLVLFEALAGKRGFEKDSPVETLTAIINDPTPSLNELSPTVPLEAQKIIDRALAKEPNDRYQHAGDMKLDLINVRRAIDSNSRLTYSRPVRPWRLPSWLRWAAAAAIVMVVVAAGWIIAPGNLFSAGQPTARFQPGKILMTPLTTDAGYEGEPTFAPDGERIAYVSDRGGNLDIYLKQISGGPDINLTQDRSDDAQPAFSPDGNLIAFVSSRASLTQLEYRNPVVLGLMGGDVWVMSALGGAPKRIATEANFPTWSPDGSEIIYVSGPFADQRIYRVPALGGNATEIETRFEKRPSYLAYPSISRDGKWVAFETQPDKIFVVPAGGGQPLLVANGKHPIWDPKTNSIIYSNASAGTNYSLWQIPFSSTEGKIGGKPEPITVSEGRNMQAAISQDGKTIVYAAQTISFNIESIPFDPETGKLLGQPKELTTGTELKPFFDSSPDGRTVVFESNRGSTSNIWRTNGDSPPVQLTSGLEYADHRPIYSPDGRSIVFVRSNLKRSGSGEMWIMDADGANPRFITEITEANFLEWMPDGKGILYYSDGEKQLCLYDLEAKASRRITNEPGVRAGVTLSSDGKWIMFLSTKDTGSADIRAIPVQGGDSLPVIATPKEDGHPSIPPSGRWLYFQFDHKNIYRIPGPNQNWRAAEPERITNLPETNLYLEDSQLSNDGRTLFYSHGRIIGDLWLIRASE